VKYTVFYFGYKIMIFKNRNYDFYYGFITQK